MVKFFIFNFEIRTFLQGLQVMLYGLAGVFTVLILFYLVTKLLFAIARKLPQSEER